MAYSIKIQNMVVTAALGTDIVLNRLVSKLQNIEYEPDQFPGMIIRIKNPKSAILLFSSGRLVCTGTTSLKDAKLVISKVVSMLRKQKIKISRNYKVHLENIVASAELKRELNLDDIGFTLENTEYEPEQFPGLVYRMDHPRVTFLLFTSGRIICTGAKSLADVKKAVETLDKRLKKLK
ncbi:MAG: TATA-box-binding protein [Candidatus Aenigmarchaeota archaeon]|nr:TATA-box-binding protein [Candidatus Aenigmarchaeota archaeon]